MSGRGKGAKVKGKAIRRSERIAGSGLYLHIFQNVSHKNLTSNGQCLLYIAEYSDDSVAKMAKGRVTRTRATMTDIGKKTNILPASKNIQNKGIKKEAIKPTQGLTKQKTTSALQKVSEVTTRVTRQSLKKKEHELMEQNEVKITPRVIAAIENPSSDANIETGSQFEPVPGCSGTSRSKRRTHESSSDSENSDEEDTTLSQSSKSSSNSKPTKGSGNSSSSESNSRKNLASMSDKEMRLEIKYFRAKYKSLHDRVPYGSQAPWIEGEAKKKRRCGECEGMFIQHDLNLFRRLNFFRQSQM